MNTRILQILVVTVFAVLFLAAPSRVFGHDQVTPQVQQEPEETNAVRAKRLVDIFQSAVAERSDGPNTPVDEAVQEASENIVETLGRAARKGNRDFVDALIKEMKEAGIQVTELKGNSFLVRFPKAAWFCRKKAQVEKVRGIVQQDFCYTGWTLINEYWFGGPAQSYHSSTYYCYDTDSVMNCVTPGGGEPICNEPVVVS